MNAFNNGFPATYVSPYQQPQYVPIQQPVAQQPQPQNNGLVWVQGEAGAKSYLVGAGQSVILMDSEDQFFYIKTADQSGMPILRKFRFEEVTNQQQVSQTKNEDYVTREEFEKRMSELYSKKNLNNNNNNRRENKQDGKSNL